MKNALPVNMIISNKQHLKYKNYYKTHNGLIHTSPSISNKSRNTP